MGNENELTPGAWAWEDDFTKESGYVNRCLASDWGGIVYHRASWDVKPADAHVIAAAPELRDALIGLMNANMSQTACTHGEESDYCDACAYEREKAVGVAMGVARAAIDKTEGNS